MSQTRDKNIRAPGSPAHPLTRSPAHPLGGLLFLAFLALYVRTAAPSVLSGDSAEFQLAAPLLGVPHPTTYPLYVLLGKFATLIIPFGDLAWRVTLVSAFCAALAVALFFVLARRVTRSAPAALVGALALGLAPGLWNAATIAEVYAPLAALLAGLACILVTADQRLTLRRRSGQATNDQRPTADDGRSTTNEGRRTADDGRWTMDETHQLLNDPRQRLDDSGHPPPTTRHPPPDRDDSGGDEHGEAYGEIPWQRLRRAAFVSGLGFTHHGLFVIAGLPLLGGYVLWRIVRRPTADPFEDDRRRTIDHSTAVHRPSSIVGTAAVAAPLWISARLTRNIVKQAALLALCFAAGLLPWLYPLAQYARYGPFAGADYGLPRFYFWGAPASWGQAFDLLTGGPMRHGIFRAPTPDALVAVLRMVGRRLLFEFGPIGAPLGLLGSVVLLYRARFAWVGAAWAFFATLAYLLLLGSAVQDAPVFTLPMLLPWALWIAAGSAAIIEWVRDWQGTRDEGRRTNSPLSPFVLRLSSLVPLLLIAATLAWGYTRLHVSSKRQLWLFRRFGEATLARLPPGAAVITHWEQGMTLQYLILAEGLRPDVWVDVVEPGDAAWGDRARRYAGRAIFFVGSAPDVAGLPVELVREDAYADLFALCRSTRC